MTSSDLERLREAVRGRIVTLRTSQRQVAVDAGVSTEVVNGLATGRRTVVPNGRTCHGLALALRWPPTFPQAILDGSVGVDEAVQFGIEQPEMLAQQIAALSPTDQKMVRQLIDRLARP